MLAIYKKEMRAYFTSPIGYIFIAVFLAANGALFSYTTLRQYANCDTSKYFVYLLFALVVVLPLLTMKMFSEERKTRTEQLLLTAPISLSAMVVAKFLAAFSMFAGTFALGCLNFLILPLYSEGINAAGIFGSMFAILLLGAAFLAIGIFVSSLTENQLVSAIVTMAILLVLLLMTVFNSSIDSYAIRVILSFISVFSRFVNFTAGRFDFAALLYYLSYVFVFLFLTVRNFEKRRWA
jgi:ABC-2 type transport system permease protein